MYPEGFVSMDKRKRASDIKWFDISNYEPLEDLTVGEFCREIHNRITIWNSREQPIESLPYFGAWLPVLKGKVILSYSVPCSIDTLQSNEKDCLCKSEDILGLGITPVNQRLLNGIYEYSHKPQYLLSIDNPEHFRTSLCVKCDATFRLKYKNHNENGFEINLAVFCDSCIKNIAMRFPKQISPLNINSPCCNTDDKTFPSNFIDLNHYLNRKGNLLRIDLETFTDDELIEFS